MKAFEFSGFQGQIIPLYFPAFSMHFQTFKLPRPLNRCILPENVKYFSVRVSRQGLIYFLFGLSKDFPERTLMTMIHNGKISVTWKCWHGSVDLSSLVKLQL